MPFDFSIYINLKNYIFFKNKYMSIFEKKIRLKIIIIILKRQISIYILKKSDKNISKDKF